MASNLRRGNVHFAYTKEMPQQDVHYRSSMRDEQASGVPWAQFTQAFHRFLPTYAHQVSGFVACSGLAPGHCPKCFHVFDAKARVRLSGTCKWKLFIGNCELELMVFKVFNAANSCKGGDLTRNHPRFGNGLSSTLKGGRTFWSCFWSAALVLAAVQKMRDSYVTCTWTLGVDCVAVCLHKVLQSFREAADTQLC